MSTFHCDFCHSNKSKSEYHDNGNDDHKCEGDGPDCYDCCYPVSATLAWCTECNDNIHGDK